MSQSFKRLAYQLILDPLSLLQMAGCVICIPLSFLLLEEVWLFYALIWVFFFAFLSKLASRGCPAWLATPLTPNFYALRAFGGSWSIFQRRPPNARKTSCKGLLRSLAEEQRRLPSALPPGRYQALTHDTVLRRLRAMNTMRDLVCVPAYTADLGRIRRAITGGRCRRCKQHCPFPSGSSVRQFYYVTFVIDAIALNDSSKTVR